MKVRKSEERRNTMIQSLHTGGYRCTPERLCIIDVLTEQSGPVTADSVFNIVNNGSYPVSLATVYNTLELLVKNGQLVPVRIPGTTSTCYETLYKGRSQMLFICEKCGSSRKIEAPHLSKQILAQELTAGTISRFSMSVYGVCRKCARKQTVKQTDKQTIKQTDKQTIKQTVKLDRNKSL